MRELHVRLARNGSYWRAEWADPATGRPRRKSLGNAAKVSRRQAEVACRRIAADLARAPEGPAAEAQPALADWIDRYIASRGELTPASIRQFRGCRTSLLAHFGDPGPALDRITRAGAADWCEAALAGRLAPDRTPPALITVRRHVRNARQMLQAAVDQDRLAANPFDRLKRAIPPILRQWRDVSQEDLRRIMGAAPPGWRMLFALCRLAGLRSGEARRLRWADIHHAANRMTVDAGVERATTKRRTRVVPIEPARCPTGLAGLLLAARAEAVGASAGPCDAVPPNHALRARRIIRRSGIGEYAKPLHTLRKCREVELAAQYPAHVVAEWQGHSLAVSQRHYLRVPEELYAPPPKSAPTHERAGANA